MYSVNYLAFIRSHASPANVQIQILSSHLTPKHREMLIIRPKVPFDYLLVEQQSDTLPSVCATVNHVCSLTFWFQMAFVIALFLLQMFSGAASEHSLCWADREWEH